MTNSLQDIEKKVVHHNNTGSNEPRNVKSIDIKALDERYALPSNLYATINRG
ncbi:MAG TPA: hypothetical protein VE445_01330 [Nitrososphaeraceae archaeon]|nr:hypothetical protein [Nitrososphaeraceae archaeon]